MSSVLAVAVYSTSLSPPPLVSSVLWIGRIGGEYVTPLVSSVGGLYPYAFMRFWKHRIEYKSRQNTRNKRIHKRMYNLEFIERSEHNEARAGGAHYRHGLALDPPTIIETRDTIEAEPV